MAWLACASAWPCSAESSRPARCQQADTRYGPAAPQRAAASRLARRMTRPISVLIADDQDLVREGLRMLLEAEPDITVAGEASTGSEAIAAIRRHVPDVVLMDVRMPDMDGIEAAAHLARAGSRARILMLTTYDLDEYLYR